MAKKSSPKKKKSIAKKARPRKVVKSVPKKGAKKKAPIKIKTAPKKKGIARGFRNNWKVVCSKEGTIAKGLSQTAARALSTSHQTETTHATTYTNSQ